MQAAITLFCYAFALLAVALFVAITDELVQKARKRRWARVHPVCPYCGHPMHEDDEVAMYRNACGNPECILYVPGQV